MEMDRRCSVTDCGSSLVPILEGTASPVNWSRLLDWRRASRIGCVVMSPTPRWVPLEQEPDHPLAALHGAETPLGRLRVFLGPSSRYGARWFRLDADGAMLLEGLHHRGPLASHCWVEVAGTAELDDERYAHLFAWLRRLVPPGGHLMVEYDSPARADVAAALAAGVPPAATSLGEQLIRGGFAPRFKDWSISEGGLEGPRKLQCYVPSDDGTARVWREDAIRSLHAFLEAATSGEQPVLALARERARRVLKLLGVG